MTSTTYYPSVPVSTEEHSTKDVPLPFFHAQFTKIVHDWTPHLQYRAWQITKNKHAAEDIVQEAFLTLWKQRAKIIPENPVGWLIRVVTNLSARYLRNKNLQHRIHMALSEETNTFGSEVEEYVNGKEKHLLLQNIFNQLPAQQKLVLHLSKEKGLRRAEVAACLQLSPNTVKIHLHRAMRFMKDNLTCIVVFVLFFVCNNIFFKVSSTNESVRELFIRKDLNSVTISESIQKAELHNSKNLLVVLAKRTINSMNQ